MTSSEIITLLQQVPPRYELVVTQGDVTHRIFDLSFSHMPAQVTLRLVPVEPDTVSESETNTEDAAAALFAENVTLRDQNAELLLELHHLRENQAALLPTHVLPDPAAGETFGEAYVAPKPTPAKRTRKPKSAPFGIA
jgi:hypothetical protein